LLRPDAVIAWRPDETAAADRLPDVIAKVLSR
jgi:hypothetical protein